MTPRRLLARKLLSEMHFFACIHAAGVAVVFFLTGSLWNCGALLLLAIPFFLLLAVRIRTSNILAFTLLHLCIFVFPLLLPAGSITLAAVAATQLFAVVRSFYRRLAGEGEPGTAGMVVGMVLCIALCIAAGMLEQEGIVPWIALCSLVIALSCLTGSQMARVDQALDIITSTTRQPVDSILRFNNAIIAIFMVLASGVAALSLLLPVGSFFRLLGQGLLVFLRWLVGLIPGSGTVGEAAGELAGVSPGPAALPVVEPAGPSRLLELLEQFMVYAVTVLLVLAAIAALGYGIYRLYRRFYSGRNAQGDVLEFVQPDITAEKLAGSLRVWFNKLAPFSADKNEKIRRAYTKKVRRHMRRGIAIRRQDTPGEIAAKIQPKEDIAALTAQYEQARYGAGSQEKA